MFQMELLTPNITSRRWVIGSSCCSRRASRRLARSQALSKLQFPFTCELLSRHFHRRTQFDINSNQVDKIFSIACRVASAGFHAMRLADLLA
jgi:hypothetical protein